MFHLLQPELSRSMGLRVLEAAATGADSLVTACPATIGLLREVNATPLAVRDLVEVVADCLEG